MAVVDEEQVRAAVVRVEGRIGHLAVVVARDADEEVEVAVAVDVREGGGTRVFRDADSRGLGHVLERAVAAVAEEVRRAERVREEEVGKAVAVDVARGDAGGREALRCRARESRRDGHVREVAAAVVAVEDRPHAVPDEEVLGAVLIEVENRDAGAGPDVRDQAVREPERGIAARRAQPCLPGGVMEARRGLRTVGNGGRHGHFDSRIRRARARTGLHGNARGTLDSRAVPAEAADGEEDGTRDDFLRVLARDGRLADLEGDESDPIEPVPRPRP